MRASRAEHKSAPRGLLKREDVPAERATIASVEGEDGPGTGRGERHHDRARYQRETANRSLRARQIGHRPKLVPYHTHPSQCLSQSSCPIADQFFVVDLRGKESPRASLRPTPSIGLAGT
jgi:hypothetical protein